MSKKILAILLCAAILIGLIPGMPVSAAITTVKTPEKPEFIQGEFEYRILGDETIYTMNAYLGHNTDIYVTIEDAAAMAGFDLAFVDGEYLFSRAEEVIWSLLDLKMSEDGVCGHDQETVPYYEDDDGERWYSLVHILYYLRAQFTVDDTKEDEVAVISRAEAKDLLSVWLDYSDEFDSLQLTQKDLYIAHGAAATTLEASFGVVFDEGFDVRIIVPFWGSNAVIEDQYEQALLTLAQEDGDYVVDEDGTGLQKIVEKYHYELSDPWTTEIIGMTGVPHDLIELFDEVDKMDGFTKDIFSTQLDLPAESLTKLKTINKVGTGISWGVEAVSAFNNYVDVAERSKTWKKSFVEGLELLRDVDKKPFSSKNSVEQIKDASRNLVKEYNDPIQAAEDAVWEQGAIFFAKMAVSKMFPVGALLAILDTCLGISDVMFNDEIDVGKTTFLVDCLIDISNVAGYYLKYEVSRAMQEANTQGYISQETIDHIRAYALMSLRASQRTYAYVYSLEMQNDASFKNSKEAEAARNVMKEMLVMMGLITATDEYDHNLLSLFTSQLLSGEPFQIRRDLSESLFRTVWIGGSVVEEETQEPIAGATIEVYRSDAPEVIFATTSTDNKGQWEIKLDNRYDYTFTFRAMDEEGEEYSITYEGTSAEEINAKENYVYFLTKMNKNREELFYAYLRANVVPKIGICDGASFTTKLENKDMESGGGTGLLSAYVDDLDMDGSLEMVTVTVSVKDTTSDMIASLVYGTERSIVSLDIDLYELVDGEVVHADGPRNIAYIEKVSYGSCSVSVCQWEGITYFYGHSNNDDQTTYGPNATAIYHAEDGKLVFDYAAGGSWGQGLPGTDDNEKLNTRNMDLTNTIFEVSGSMERISLLTVDIATGGTNATVDIGITDFSYMVEALENGYKTIRERAQALLKLVDEHEETAREEIEERIKRMEAFKNSPAGKTVTSVIDYVTATSGIALTMMNESTSEDGSYSASYKTDDKAFFHIHVDASGVVTSLAVEARTYTQTDEWIALKDAILTVPELGLPSTAVSAFSGKLSTQSANEEYNGYGIQVHNIDNFYIGITKK